MRQVAFLYFFFREQVVFISSGCVDSTIMVPEEGCLFIGRP